MLLYAEVSISRESVMTHVFQAWTKLVQHEISEPGRINGNVIIKVLDKLLLKVT